MNRADIVPGSQSIRETDTKKKKKKSLHTHLLTFVAKVMKGKQHMVKIHKRGHLTLLEDKGKIMASVFKMESNTERKSVNFVS